MIPIYSQRSKMLLVVAPLTLALGVVSALVSLAATGQPARAAEASVTWPSIFLTPVITSGLSQPVHITHAGDGSGRLFVVERVGRIRLIKASALLGTPFLDITDRVEAGYDEQGLLSVAFPPNYSSQGHFYVYYTNHSNALVISRFSLTAPDVADPNSEEIVLTIDHSSNLNHDGGQLAFGPNDGYLYIGTGDGGGGGDPGENAQDPNELLGKLLRINVETNDPLTYTIPASNPYTQTAGYRGEIWALGLRNPWRFSFDQQTGGLFIGDVGQGAWEEIDFQPESQLLPGTDPRNSQMFYTRLTPLRRFITMLGGMVFRAVMDIRTSGVEHLPATGPVMLVANHVSNYDVIPMQLSLPRPFFPMAKSEMFQLPILGWFYRQLGAFPVQRGAQDQWALDHAAKILAAGQVLLMFPEGTRNRGQGLKAAKTGAARLAIQAHAPVVPLAILGTQRIFKPWYRHSRVTVTVGEPLWPERHETPAALTDRMMFALARLLPPEFRGVHRQASTHAHR